MARQYDNTSIGGDDRHFPATEWTRLLDPRQCEALMAELYEKYWKPLYSFLRYKGFSNEQAKDLVQDFFTEKIIGQELAKSADRSRGRFRNFLLVALRNYTINIQKRDRRNASISLDECSVDLAAKTNAESEFNRAWAEELLKQVLDELRIECEQKGRTTHWHLFQEWLLEPGIEQGKLDMESLRDKYGVVSNNQAYKIIFRVKQRFRRLLRDHLGAQVSEDEEVDAEIGEFLEAFSRK